MTKVTITALKDTERTSQRTGKPFTSRGIRVNEYGERWLSGFAGKDNASWTVGDTVEIDVEEKGEYLNFTVPKGSGAKGSSNNDEVLAALRQTYAEVRAAKVEVEKMRVLLTDVIRNMTLSGMYKEHTSDGNEAPSF
jgi:hypothetical protein